MAPEHLDNFDSQHLRETQEHTRSLYSSALALTGNLYQRSELTPGTVPSARIGKQGDLFFGSEPSKDLPEKPEPLLDRKIKNSFGADVFDHLKDSAWLIDNRTKLEGGFKKASSEDLWDMVKRMQELSTVDGEPLIYTSKVDGPSRGNLIPKRHDIFLRRGTFRSDDYIGQVYH